MNSVSPLDVLIAELEADRVRLKAAVEHVPESLRDKRAVADRWSVAEIIEHLVIVEQRATAIIAELASSAPPRRAEADDADVAITFDRSALRDRTQRVAAPVPLHPTGQWNAEQGWAALERSRIALVGAIHAAEGRDLAAVSRPHPRLGSLTGYAWIAALGGHEERHTAQIEEVADSMMPGMGLLEAEGPE